MSYESKTVTVNTTYCKKTNSTIVRYTRYGKIVIVEVYDIGLIGGKSSDNVAIIASGLPKPKIEVCANFPTNTRTVATEYVRVRILSDGTLKPWYCGTTINNTNINGSFVYIAQ